jgi:protein-tyrosine phosphatase
VVETWDPTGAGVMPLPSGRLVRGRGLRRPREQSERSEQEPTFGVYLLGSAPAVSWPHRWVRCPDFWVPRDRVDARDALREAWERAADGRVEVGCGGGLGRTGMALACLAVIDGVPAHEAVAYVRRHNNPRAVETPWQRRFVRRFA